MSRNSWESRSRQGGSHWLNAEAGMRDTGVVTGLVIAVALLLAGAVLGGTKHPFAAPVSFLIVFGGTLGATLINFSWLDIENAYQAFKGICRVKQYDLRGRISQMVLISQKVRRDGLLVLESAAKETNDPFLKVALDLAVDAQSPEEIRRTLEIEMRSSYDRAARSVQVLETMGTYAPALGLIGTLIGLIEMLSQLNDPSSVGPAMGVALITTLYGAVISNLFFLPVAGKVRLRLEEENLVKSLTIEGVMCIAKQDNPLMVEQKLQNFVPLASNM